MPDSPPSSASPLHALHAAAGASFTDFAGWQMPVSYGSDLAEHHAVRTAAGLFDISHMGEIVVIGPDAAAALDHALAGRLSASALWQAKYTLMLAPEGGIVDDLIVYRTADDRFLVVANAGNRAEVARELAARTAGFDAQVFDESDDIALLALQGPAALGILRALDGFDVPGFAELGYYRCAAGTWGEHDVLVARTGYTGEDGFELYLDPDAAPALWRALLETGADSGLIACGLAARDTLRLEAGMPLYGHELGLDTLPVQAGLGRVVALATKGDFVGRDAIERGAAPGARVLVGLTTEGRRAGRAGYGVFVDDSRSESTDGTEPPTEPVGIVTSGALSPTLGHPIAMAYVAPEVADGSVPLAIDVRGTRIPASVVPLPFYTREKK
ncbi:glycine cleavage system aminomethyltransferase GcvT [Galbitalea sp. SE-J8]|uniref:glycine cleavage system aminomethyltransferase GcvT n=1 Tax=Galbitalea sp. SE-J8 TaxID=3054952 RepID=UPI00259CE83C|nr:glycine cleavage system aminomethyltransferase GcvT [Galbitalea sp. SE-J8]MDM4763358.1 glycine cleavage system aminomethyltransferase GcvT [Galbitalea sp. SE-J8]